MEPLQPLSPTNLPLNFLSLVIPPSAGSSLAITIVVLAEPFPLMTLKDIQQMVENIVDWRKSEHCVDTYNNQYAYIENSQITIIFLLLPTLDTIVC